MPLLRGSDKGTIAHNIQEMVRAGHPIAQAQAAAFNVAGKSKGKKKATKRGSRRTR